MSQGTNGSGMKALSLKLKELGSKQLQIGWFESAKEDDGTPSAYVAAINEFGYPGGGIPARPFMRPTVEAKKVYWSKVSAKVFKGVADKTMTANSAMDALGGVIAGDIKAAITKVTSPSLAEGTILNRLSRKKKKKVTLGLVKPLVDTGRMIESLTFVVKGGK